MNKKLKLNKETVSRLDNGQLGRVVGGITEGPCSPTHDCVTLGCGDTQAWLK